MRHTNEVEILLGIDGPEVVSTSGKRILLMLPRAGTSVLHQ
jgi:hypothetical protein